MQKLFLSIVKWGNISGRKVGENWRNPENEKTAFYAEYKSYGEGAQPAARVKWSKQLSAKEARQYTLKKILAADDDWRPESEMRYTQQTWQGGKVQNSWLLFIALIAPGLG